MQHARAQHKAVTPPTPLSNSAPKHTHHAQVHVVPLLFLHELVKPSLMRNWSLIIPLALNHAHSRCASARYDALPVIWYSRDAVMRYSSLVMAFWGTIRQSATEEVRAVPCVRAVRTVRAHMRRTREVANSVPCMTFLSSTTHRRCTHHPSTRSRAGSTLWHAHHSSAQWPRRWCISASMCTHTPSQKHRNEHTRTRPNRSGPRRTHIYAHRNLRA